MSNITDAVVNIINTIALCENIQGYLEINCGNCEVARNIVIEDKQVFCKELFNGAMLKLIKENRNIDLNSLIEVAGPENSLDITGEWFEHLKCLNREYNRLNKKQEIKSVEQYMSELSYNKDVRMQYPSTEELEYIRVETKDLGKLDIPEKGIILANLDINSMWYMKGLEKLSKDCLVMILTTNPIKDDFDLVEIDLSDYMEIGKKKNKKDLKYYLFVFRGGYLIDKYF